MAPVAGAAAGRGFHPHALALERTTRECHPDALSRDRGLLADGPVPQLRALLGAESRGDRYAADLCPVSRRGPVPDCRSRPADGGTHPDLERTDPERAFTVGQMNVFSLVSTGRRRSFQEPVVQSQVRGRPCAADGTGAGSLASAVHSGISTAF